MVYVVLLAALPVLMLCMKATSLVNNMDMAMADAGQALNCIKNINMTEGEKEKL